MHDLLILADSEVAAVEAGPGEVVLRFAAAHVERPAADGPIAGHVTGLALHLTTTPGQTLPPDLLGRIAAGHLRIDGQRHARLAIPGEFCGELLLELDFANRSSLTLRAHAARLTMSDDARFTESLAC